MGRWNRLFACLAAAALAACGPGDAADTGEAGPAASASGSSAPATSDADSAAHYADRLMAWQGGREAWEATRFLRFRWIVERGGETVVERSHAWDRWTGRYRLSYTRPDSARFLALFDVGSLASDTVPPEGDAWVGGERLEGAARDSALRDAYGAFINDSYWLLMPLKWGDPGVHLEYQGTTPLPDGEAYPTVHLTFDAGLGVTEDEYWAFLEPASGRMAAWRYHLQGREEKGDLIWWEDWRTFGPQELKLSTNRRFSSGDARIHFEEVAADTAVPDGTFAPPGG